MTTTAPALPASGPVKDPTRTTAFVAGMFYLTTFMTSIPTLALYAPVHLPGFVLGSGPDTGVQFGGLLELLLAFSCVGTAITLFPVLRRQNEGLAFGFVATRLMEAGLILVGVASLFTVVTLRHDPAGADPEALAASGRALVTLHDWTFVLGQSLMPVANAVVLGSLLYRSRLVPRALPLLGLAGAPLLLASVTATIFGLFDQTSAVAVVAALPVALWELSLGIWLVVKGFTPGRLSARV